MSKRNNFTLLEIVLCVAILGTAAVTVSWQMRGMFHTHNFNRNVDSFLTDLQKCQLVALSDRVDIEVRIEKKGGTYQYSLYSDDPVPCFVKKPMKMNGVEKIKVGKKKVDRYVLNIYASGAMTPKEEITLFQDDEIGTAFKLDKSPTIKVKRLDRRDI
ncbi:MAG: hypothetical protein P0S96_02885 [Simkaniaceae bacterium]|nr:hypothetical protein [Candidatus Sacchlamyda saccharinae]